MGELYALGFLALSVAGIVGYFVTKYLPGKPQLNLNEGGTWRRTQETVADRSGSRVLVLLVREHEGRETGRLPICEISSEDPDWNNKYMEAIVRADNRLAMLESAERH